MIKVNKLTRGHRLLLEKMGFGCFMETEEAAQLWKGYSDRQQKDALVAAVWLASCPMEEVVPGGIVHSAIKSATWERLLEAFQFRLDDEFSEQLPRLFAEAAGLDYAEEGAEDPEEDEPLVAESALASSEPCDSCR